MSILEKRESNAIHTMIQMDLALEMSSVANFAIIELIELTSMLNRRLLAQRLKVNLREFIRCVDMKLL